VAQFSALPEFLLGEIRKTTETLSKFIRCPDRASKQPPPEYRSEVIRVVPGCSFLTASRRQTSETAEIYAGLDPFYCHSWPATRATRVRHNSESECLLDAHGYSQYGAHCLADVTAAAALRLLPTTTIRNMSARPFGKPQNTLMF
jgi:hypothetical protein